MTIDIKAIKARCKAAEEVGAMLHHTVVRACLDEIEHLRTLVQDAYYEGGNDAHAHMVWDNSNACKALTE